MKAIRQLVFIELGVFSRFGGERVNSKIVEVRKLTRLNLLLPPKPIPSGRSDSPIQAQRERFRKPRFFGVLCPGYSISHCWDGGAASFFFPAINMCKFLRT